MKVLAIESSCDDTAAAVLIDREVRSNVVASQDGIHERYGGVVPELASRNHLRAIVPTVQRALEAADVSLDRIDAVAATYGPGLVGSLLVGLCTAKAIAYARNIPFVGVNHLEGHLLSVQIEHKVDFPYLALLVSGGHTGLYLAHGPGRYEILGRTRDDAAGEAFDKVARMLGLGYPGGRVVDALARQGNPAAIHFPRARLKPRRNSRRYDFSFSGLKTAVWLHVQEYGADATSLADLLASFQEAVVDMLLDPAFSAARETGIRRLVLAGGVSANARLRARASAEGKVLGIEVVSPSAHYCTDNAAMIGIAAAYRLERGERDPLTLNAAAIADLDSLADEGVLSG